jgi:acyl carrier protein
MSFTPSEFWKNFRLGTELSISGNFIYNGLYSFDQMPHFYYEDEAFEFLYNISVGIERLQKICIILLEHNDDINQEEFEKNLISHNHHALHSRIEKHKNFNLGKPHKKLLAILTKFYKSSRYELYQIQNVFKPNQSKLELIKFLEESLDIKISAEMVACTSNEPRIKKFIGKVIGKFCEEYYQIVVDECTRLKLFTYEIPYESKAFKIFMSKKYDFDNEKIIQKEILKYLIQGDLPKSFVNHIESKPPLNLNFYDLNYYLQYLFSFHKEYSIKGEIEDLYTELDNVKERIEHLEPIAHPDASFSFDEEE